MSDIRPDSPKDGQLPHPDKPKAVTPGPTDADKEGKVNTGTDTKDSKGKSKETPPDGEKSNDSPLSEQSDASSGEKMDIDSSGEEPQDSGGEKKQNKKVEGTLRAPRDKSRIGLCTAYIYTSY